MEWYNIKDRTNYIIGGLLIVFDMVIDGDKDTYMYLMNTNSLEAFKTRQRFLNDKKYTSVSKVYMINQETKSFMKKENDNSNTYLHKFWK